MDSQSDVTWLPPETLLAAAETEEILQEFIELFANDTRERLVLLSAAVAAGDSLAVRKQAHSLKSSCGQMGAHTMATLSRTLELTAGGEQLNEAVPLVLRLEDAFASSLNAMRAYLERPSR